MEIYYQSNYLQKIMYQKGKLEQNQNTNFKKFATGNNYYQQKIRRLFTQPIQLENNRSFQKVTERSFQKNNQFSLFKKDNFGKLPRGVINIRNIEKKILNISQSFDSKSKDIRIGSRQKKRIIFNLKNQLGQMIKKKQKELKPAEKMMIDFERELKRIKRHQNLSRFDTVKQNKERFESYSVISHRANTQIQDSTKFGEGIHILCDAHGSNGRQVAKFVCQNIYTKVLQRKKQGKIDKKSIFQVFQLTHRQLELSGVDIAFSGSTCLLVIILEKEILIANLGDSRAILKKQHKIQVLSTFHVPSLQSERERISIIGGVVRQQEVSKGKFVGPLKLWAPGKNSWGPGLAISRSFGHKAARRYGLISQPQINFYSLELEQTIIVMGTKGLFEAFKNEDVFDVIKKLMCKIQDKQRICQILADQAMKKTEEQIEDISVILIFL